MLSVDCCGVARLQMKDGHMDGMHCFIDSTSILVKIKSVSLYNCRTVYVAAVFYNSVSISTDSQSQIQRYIFVTIMLCCFRSKEILNLMCSLRNKCNVKTQNQDTKSYSDLFVRLSIADDPKCF